MDYALGVDIGGTNIATVIIDEQNNILHREEVESISDDKNQMFDQVVKAIDLVLVNSKFSLDKMYGMGVGVPGKIDKQRGIAVYQNNLPWHNFPLVKRLQDHYQFNHIQIDNDVYLAALAEWQASNLDEQDTFVYITVSTGVSCSIINQGKFLRGAGFAGEVGLFPVSTNTTPEGWNRLEKVVSGPAIERLARKKLNQPNINAKDIFQKYQNDHPDAIAMINDMAESLAHGVNSIICLLDPHKIVFGGGVMNNNPLLLDLIAESLEKHLIPEQQHALQHMQISHFKENAGVVGAGLMGFNSENKKSYSL